jgi:hypothetical protein
MIDQETKNYIDQQIREHFHDGNLSQRVNERDIFGLSEPENLASATIATTGNTDAYLIAPRTLTAVNIYFSGTDVLAASNTDYITWTITNLGQTGAGSAALLAATDANTTKATGGTAIAANTKRALSLSTTPTNVQVVEGDRLRVRAAVTGTLANAVTFPAYLFIFQ